MNSDSTRANEINQEAFSAGAADARAADLKDPRFVLALLEADQVVAAKRQSRFGRQRLTLAKRAMLWGLRVYVVVMLVIVLISVFQAVHGAH